MIYIDDTQELVAVPRTYTEADSEELPADSNNDFSIGDGVPNTLDIPKTYNTEE